MDGHNAIMTLYKAGDKWSPVLAQELDQIKVQLKAYFSVIPHKIETISLGIGYKTHSTITMTQHSNKWIMSTRLNGGNEELYRHHSLINVLMWGIANRQLNRSSEIVFTCPESTIAVDSSQLLRYLTEAIQHQKPGPTENIRPKLTQCILILNASKRHPVMHLSNSANHIKDIIDPLHHGITGNCLILQADLIGLNDWGEIFVESGNTTSLLLQCLLSYLQFIMSKPKGDNFSVQCFNGIHSQALKTRIQFINHQYGKMV